MARRKGKQEDPDDILARMAEEGDAYMKAFMEASAAESASLDAMLAELADTTQLDELLASLSGPSCPVTCPKCGCTFTPKG